MDEKSSVETFSSAYLQEPPISRSDGRCVQRAGTEPEHDCDAYLLDIPTSRRAMAKNDRRISWN